MKRLLLLALMPLAGCASQGNSHGAYQQPYIAPIQPMAPAYQMPINRSTITDCQRFGNQMTCTTR